ncbi:GTP 3',8-cyclase MoaA [Parapedobacter sp. 10938]|uniref:GTP 3',8-cyclase MoaA n=1 Tax=Parapedobacter flavus TaxID=3110225 RepID=UPI002DB9B782|nr:GTP 3',8-cyclase MoaA [Parapedobacter sp. 10938]MEC3878222.1 GTP 3',8-cyclase MoaA [Parapedobacter sp. 10938]
MALLKDDIGRSFRVLRVSLLDTCNFACTYCVCDDQHPTRKAQANTLSVHELTRLIGHLHRTLNLRAVRLTGGEPLLYADLVPLIEGIRSLGIRDIKMTTNGFLLARKVEALQRAGLQSINVSLDALDEQCFFRVTKRVGVERVIAGIATAKNAGMDVKINTVVMRGENDHELLPLLDFAFRHGLKIRLLELMGMGHLYGTGDGKFFSKQEMLVRIASRYRIRELAKRPGETATYWATACGHSFGIIANESQPFCSDCNRLRLDINGNIYGCLSSNTPIPIADIATQKGLEASLDAALAQKQLKFTGSEMSMLTIGG